MISRVALLLAGLVLFAAPTWAQRCQWCDRGGKDLKWVKIMWFTYDEKQKPKVLNGLHDSSMYKPYKGIEEKKRHEVDADLLRDWVPEIFGGERGEADGYYFLCFEHFDGEGAGDVEMLPLGQGREFERGIECAGKEKNGKACPRKGFKQLPNVRKGVTVDENWYCSVHLAQKQRDARKKDPLLMFGGLAAVVILGVLLGIVGIKIGDKERALDEAAFDDEGGGRRRR